MTTKHLNRKELLLGGPEVYGVATPEQAAEAIDAYIAKYLEDEE